MTAIAAATPAGPARPALRRATAEPTAPGRCRSPSLERHLNHIRYNPIKHRLVGCAHAWRWSSFHRLVRNGVYDATWCCGCDGRTPVTVPDFGVLDTQGIEVAFGE